MVPYLFCSLENVWVNRNAKILASLCALFLLCPTVLLGQQPDTDGSDGQTVRLLLEKVGELEASQRQLSERLAKLEKAQSVGVARDEARSSLDPPRSAEPPALPPSTSASLHNASSKANLSAVNQSGQQDEMNEPEHRDVSKTLL